MDDQKLIDTATAIGCRMLEHGADIYRVEETISRICLAYGAKEVDVFAIPSSIVVSVTGADGGSWTRTRRIKNQNVDLDKLDRFNNLSRVICRDRPAADWVEGEIARINAQPVYSSALQAFACALVSFFFTLFFGGDLRDASVAFAAGLAMKYFSKRLERFGLSSFLINIAASATAGAFAFLSVRFGAALHIDKIIIGTLMNLVPGLSLTNSIRDFIVGDLMAGLMKLTETLLTATGIAIGVMLALRFLGGVFGGV